MSRQKITPEHEHEHANDPAGAQVTWGPWIFRLTLAGTLLFMWWLVIYDHGVTTSH